VLLPLEADEKLEALKHYYGITYTNELIVRGIEARRHDALNFIKDFQSELLYTLFDCKDSEEGDGQSSTFVEEETLSSKIIDEVYDVLEKYGITGGGSRDFFWRQLAAEYACEIIRRMTENEVLRDIGCANIIIVNRL
jgi:hypothetical protein